LALRIPAWSDHQVTRYALGLTGEGMLARRRGLLPDSLKAATLAAVLAAVWLALPLMGYRYNWYQHRAGLAMLFLPIPLALVIGYWAGIRAVSQLRGDAMLRGLAGGSIGEREFQAAFTVGVAARALVPLSVAYQALFCVFALDHGFLFHTEVSGIFTGGILFVNLLTAAGLVLDYGILLGFESAGKVGRGMMGSISRGAWEVPLALVKLSLALVLGCGIGGLVWLSGRVEALERESHGKLADTLRMLEDQPGEH